MNKYLDENEIGKIVVDTAVKIHKALGPGLLESVYELIMAKQLEKRGLHVSAKKKLILCLTEKRMTEDSEPILLLTELLFWS